MADRPTVNGAYPTFLYLLAWKMSRIKNLHWRKNSGNSNPHHTVLSVRLHWIGILKYSFQLAEPSYIGLMFFRWISKGTFSKKSNKFENGFKEKARRVKKMFWCVKRVGRQWDKWCVSYYSNLPQLEICKLVHTMG